MIKINTQWLVFEEQKPNKKTKVFSVKSRHDGSDLGVIKWYPQWRHYCHIIDGVVFSDRCHFDIGDFIKRLNDEHKTGDADE